MTQGIRFQAIQVKSGHMRPVVGATRQADLLVTLTDEDRGLNPRPELGDTFELKYNVTHADRMLGACYPGGSDDDGEGTQVALAPSQLKPLMDKMGETSWFWGRCRLWNKPLREQVAAMQTRLADASAFKRQPSDTEGSSKWRRFKEAGLISGMAKYPNVTFMPEELHKPEHGTDYDAIDLFAALSNEQDAALNTTVET